MTQKLFSGLLIACILLTATWVETGWAEETEVIPGLVMGASQDEVVSILKQHCETVSSLSYHQVSFPLAAQTEIHLVCDGYKGGPIEFSKAAFVIADGVFVHMETAGANSASVHDALGEPDGSYLGMIYFKKGVVWLDESNNRIIWLASDALHPNLFVWSNPSLKQQNPKPVTRSTNIPGLLDFSRGFDELMPLFEAQCPQSQVQEIENIWLPNQPKKQVQINCFGFPFAGFERKFEAVFGDGKLEVVWVLTSKAEESRLRDLLINDWGEPVLVNTSWEVFGDGRISLYKDKPEFLILSDDMIPLYQEEFRGNQAE